MGEKQWKNRWRRLDNTAKIFPVIANENVSQVFRISVTLKEKVDEKLLEQALVDILPEIRNFRVRLRRGLFWYYFEENDRIPQVKRENTYPCRFIDPHGNQRFLFRVTYYEKRINLEVFHALTDGLGAVNFLKCLTRQYLRLAAGASKEITQDDEHARQQEIFHVQDSYLEHGEEGKPRSYTSRPAYQLEGHYLPLGSGQVLHGYVSVGGLKAVCKKHGVSITKYLAAVLIWSIWKEYLGGKSSRRAVVLNLPINLRAFFGSDTMANFFAVTMIGWLFNNPDIPFEVLLKKVSSQMDRKIDKNRLAESIAYNVSNEKKWYLRTIPLFLKSPALGFVFRLKDRAYTMTLSNIGPIFMEPEYADMIERFHLMIGVSRRQPVKCAVCAYKDEMVITFTSVFADSRLQKRFFKKLKEDGIKVRFEGNEPSGAAKRSMYPRIRKVLIRRGGGEEKATRMAKIVGNTGIDAAKEARDYMLGRKSWKEELKRRLHV